MNGNTISPNLIFITIRNTIINWIIINTNVVTHKKMTSNEHHYQQFFKSVQRKYPNISKQLYKSIYKENLKFALEGCPVHSHHFVGVSKLVEVLCLCELALYNAKNHDSIVSQNTVRRRKRKRKIVVSHGGDGDKDGKVGMVERMDAISFSDDVDVGGGDIEGRVQSCEEDNKGEEQAMTLRGGSIGNGVSHCFIFNSHLCYNHILTFSLFYL